MKMSKERMAEIDKMDMSDKRAIFIFAHTVLQVEAKIMAQAGIDPDGNVGSIDQSLEHMAGAACDIAYMRHLFTDDSTIEADIQAETNPWLVAFDDEYQRAQFRAREETNAGK